VPEYGHFYIFASRSSYLYNCSLLLLKEEFSQHII
jgi:hypothetical protein